MITYEQVQSVMPNPPTIEMVDLFNEISIKIHQHPHFVDDNNPFNQLQEVGKFCLSATSIQEHYIAFILGKHVQHAIPEEVMSVFFNLDTQYRLQHSKITGKVVDGYICLIHQQEEDYDLQKVYDHIYA